ncbi:MAG: tail fiber protein [Ferruginibacter sp.]
MADTPFLSEIKIFSFNFAPHNWAMCNGQILPINQNQALFALLGTTYGGNGVTTFALPDLRGRTAMHAGNGITQGQVGGEAAHTLILAEMPSHTHSVNASNNNADQTYPTANDWSKGGSDASFHTVANSTMSAGTISNAGTGQSHENRSPYLVLTACMALVGIFPSRN